MHSLSKIFVLLTGLVLLGSGCIPVEYEGTIDISDCRAQNDIKEDSINKFTHSFTCEYNKNNEDKIIGGTCCRVVTSSQDGTCLESYCYEKASSIVCPDDAFPSSDKGCECIKDDYFWNLDNGRCVKTECIENAHATGLNLCNCDSGFTYNKDQNTCERTEYRINN